MPDGLDSSAGENGRRLSGGQRQRLALARALVRRPSLLILDEATSALDRETEMRICQTIRRIADDIFVVAESHTSAFVGVADLVYRLENGRLYADKLPTRAGEVT